MKKFGEWFSIIFVLTIVVAAVLAVIISGDRSTHMHYVCIECNPRVEFITDDNHNVKSFKPLNQEAKELLIGEEIIGLPMEDVTIKFLTLCAKSGYLKIDGSNNAVKLTVLSGINQTLEVRLASNINKFFVDNNILGILIESPQDLQQYKAAKKAGMCSEKYDLAMAVKESYSDMEIDYLKKLSNSELVKLIEYSHNQYDNSYTEQELNNKQELINSYGEIYDQHIGKITPESTKDFKSKLKEFRAKNSKEYKVDYNKKYNEWLVG